MYRNGGGSGARAREATPENVWPSEGNDNGRLFKKGKAFIRCICPKCTAHHNIYMLWTGRGVPRKYCPGCRPLVSGYDGAAITEATVNVSGHSRKKGRHEAE